MPARLLVVGLPRGVHHGDPLAAPVSTSAHIEMIGGGGHSAPCPSPANARPSVELRSD